MGGVMSEAAKEAAKDAGKDAKVIDKSVPSISVTPTAPASTAAPAPLSVTSTPPATQAVPAVPAKAADAPK